MGERRGRAHFSRSAPRHGPLPFLGVGRGLRALPLLVQCALQYPLRHPFHLAMLVIKGDASSESEKMRHLHSDKVNMEARGASVPCQHHRTPTIDTVDLVCRKRGDSNRFQNPDDWNCQRSHWIGHCPARNCPVLAPRRCAGGRRIAGTSAPAPCLRGWEVPVVIAIKGHAVPPGNCVTTRRGLLSCPWLPPAARSCSCRPVSIRVSKRWRGRCGVVAEWRDAVSHRDKKVHWGVISSMLTTFSPSPPRNFFFPSLDNADDETTL
jgi:hypothetical protein